MIDGVDEAGREAAVVRSGVLGLGAEPLLRRIVATVAGRYRTAYAALSIITGGRQVLVARTGFAMDGTARDASFCAIAIQRPGEALVVPDARRDARFRGLATVTGAPFIRFYAGMPVVDASGFAMGALCVGDTAPLAAPFDALDLMIKAREVERLLGR